MQLIKFPNGRSFRSYLKAGCFLHVMTLVELALLWMVFPLVDIAGKEMMDTGDAGELLLISFLAVLPLFSQLDARSRYQNYKQLKDQLYLYGFDRRIFRPVQQSRCQRSAAQTAADELGHGENCRAYFESCGYDWYHIVPDFVFRKPHFLLTGKFWKKTFFMPTYQPKAHLEP